MIETKSVNRSLKHCVKHAISSNFALVEPTQRKSELINLRLTSIELARIKQRKTQLGFSTVSEFLSSAINSFVNEKIIGERRR